MSNSNDEDEYAEHTWTLPNNKTSSHSNISINKIEKSCTCGAWKTYGKEVDLGFHQSYCDLIRLS